MLEAECFEILGSEDRGYAQWPKVKLDSYSFSAEASADIMPNITPKHHFQSLPPYPAPSPSHHFLTCN